MKYLELAKQVALLSDKPQRIGAVLVDKGRVVSVSCNLSKSHPVQARLNKLRFIDDKCLNHIHAETACLLLYKGKLKKPELYIYRVKNDGKVGMSKPCKACQELIRQYGITKVYFTTEQSIEKL